MLEGILVGIIDASLLRKAMQSCSGVDTSPCQAVRSSLFDRARSSTGPPGQEIPFDRQLADPRVKPEDKPWRKAWPSRVRALPRHRPNRSPLARTGSRRCREPASSRHKSDGVDGAPTASNVPRWSLSNPICVESRPWANLATEQATVRELVSIWRRTSFRSTASTLRGMLS